MPARLQTTLTNRIQQLLEERQQHADALAGIDQTLEQIRSALQHIGTNGRRRRGRPRGTGRAVGRPRGRRRRRGTFATTAEDMILSLVRQRGGATTREIKEKWKSEGRGGTADNALSKMVKDKKLKRSPIEGQRGSRFSVA